MLSHMLVVLTLGPLASAAAQAAASSLNFPASNYLGERQRFGPDLSAFLLELGWAARAWPACPPVSACLSTHFGCAWLPPRRARIPACVACGC